MYLVLVVFGWIKDKDKKDRFVFNCRKVDIIGWKNFWI